MVPVGALVFCQALKEAGEGMVRFHSFPSDQPGLGTSQPRDALVGQLVPVAPEPGGSVHLVNLSIAVTWDGAGAPRSRGIMLSVWKLIGGVGVILSICCIPACIKKELCAFLVL